MLSPRQFLIVVASGLGAALIVIAVGLWLAPREPTTDGSFELVEPGVFVEPSGTTVAPGSVGDVLGIGGLEDADGGPADLDIYRGGPVVINVWFSTCAPCERELRDLAEVHAAHGDEVAFVGVNPFDSADVMLDFAAERGVSYDLLRDPGQRFVAQADVTAFPTTLIVNAEGNVVERLGVLTAGELNGILDALTGSPGTARTSRE